MTDSKPNISPEPRTGFSGLQVAAMLLATVLVVAVLAWWVITRYVLPTELEQVNLSRQEQITLDRKLETLGVQRQRVDGSTYDYRVVPEPYSEAGAPREVAITERELNGLFARDPQWQSRMAVDLAPDLISVIALVPVPEDFPVLPGKSVRVRAGAEFSFNGGRPMLILKGVSVMGVPLPNAWLGNLKNVDLIAESGNEAGFWQAFADGVEYVEVGDGHMLIRLKH